MLFIVYMYGHCFNCVSVSICSHKIKDVGSNGYIIIYTHFKYEINKLRDTRFQLKSRKTFAKQCDKFSRTSINIIEWVNFGCYIYVVILIDFPVDGMPLRHDRNSHSYTILCILV